MRVVYEQTVVDQVAQALRQADLAGRRIEKIVLTGEESRRLSRELRLTFGMPDIVVAKFLFGVRLETEKGQ